MEDSMHESSPSPTPASKGSNGMMLVIAGGVVVVVLAAFLLMPKKSPSDSSMKPAESAKETTKESMTASPSSAMMIDDDDLPAVSSSPSAKAGTASPAPAMANVKEFTLDAGSFYYKPNTIKVKKGDTVRVTIMGKDMMHNFIIDELNVRSKTVKTGESDTVEFVASKAGSFEFYCGIGQHRTNGQVGTLVVE